MAETTNYHLHLTESSAERFLDWRNAMNGTSNSNMIKIDNALGDKADLSVPVHTTLNAADWVSHDGIFDQTLNVTGMTEVKNGSIGLADSATAAQRTAARDALLYVSAQHDGTLTIAGDGTRPSVDIPVTIILLG